ncbi:MAG: transcription-repair coupling factor (superfamily II helicase) [Rhodospirillaceae bacterium]|nr:MAG: transcription-repair coupling factor (superfamily II helicase) [Rhodospirillaceae bacterium]
MNSMHIAGGLPPVLTLPHCTFPLSNDTGTIAGVPEGYEALVLAEIMRRTGREILHVATDAVRLARLVEALRFFAPEIPLLVFPAWDTVPYDRVSPNREILSRRADILGRLAEREQGGEAPCLVATTVDALLQRVPKAHTFRGLRFRAKVGASLNSDELVRFLERNGYHRTDQVMESGEYALRGGIIDIFPPGTFEPLRLELLGDTLETLRRFDAVSQCTTERLTTFTVRPTSEVLLDDAAIARFRSRYRELFGTVSGSDPLYESISVGRRHPGMEHWLPLFHDGLDTLPACLPRALIIRDHQVEEARKAHLDLVFEYFEARLAAVKGEGGQIYHPVPPSFLFMDPEEWEALLSAREVVAFSPWPSADPAHDDAGGRHGHDFAAARVQPERNVFEVLRDSVAAERNAGRRVMVTAFSAGSRDRLAAVMHEHGIPNVCPVDAWAEVASLPAEAVVVTVLRLEAGFLTPTLAVISEQDILGERMARPARKRKADRFIADISALAEGDLVVHRDHGIGQYDGLVTLSVGGAPHDCLRLLYEGNDKLFVPVENIDVLSRYGSETAGVQRDRLGGTAWQGRKAKLKQRIRELAGELIRIAAERQVRQAEILVPPEGIYDEFCARFPYAETDDQLNAIAEVMADLASGRPMDRLVCGDVGFGKTEVALRAAFGVALSGLQVAVVVPTTLLARQHHQTFASRFAGLPVRVESLSRLLSAKQATAVRQGLADGTIDIIIGTHALLAKGITFKRLGLLVVDEEQHFGVAHKERLKQFKADVHVLTLTATPIPRTLQLALGGVREMSLIATPPMDRLAVRTSVLPFDPVVVREAILRERFRGGQTFYVCPRVADIEPVARQIHSLVPEVKTAIAHGRLSAGALEAVMKAFADKAFDVLLCTNIIESGLDMPSVNTLVIHRADLFGLAQLYQLRGRVGRGKAQSYAYLTVPPDRSLSQAAEKRLAVMQTLDTLGAGFTLASHDLDVRGAGNLLGEEQSGHIREVGIELYQHMLEEAVTTARSGNKTVATQDWSPQMTLGIPVLIPEHYVADLGLRLGLYRRIAEVSEPDEIDSLAVELIDRFGRLPKEVDNLLATVALKGLCRRASVNRLEAGPKGIVLGFHDNHFPEPAGLVAFITRQAGTARLRPDHKVVIARQWEDSQARLAGVRQIMETLALVAEGGGKQHRTTG